MKKYLNTECTWQTHKYKHPVIIKKLASLQCLQQWNSCGD